MSVLAVNRVQAVCGAAGLIAGVVAAAGLPQAAMARSRASAPLQAHQKNVHFAPNVITISAALAKRELIGVSARGVFKFRRAAGLLTALRPGKVMLIKSRDAVEVTGISHSHGQLVVCGRRPVPRRPRGPARDPARTHPLGRLRGSA
jgi:hypothetical protein